jgi:hypothetical protein
MPPYVSTSRRIARHFESSRYQSRVSVRAVFAVVPAASAAQISRTPSAAVSSALQPSASILSKAHAVAAVVGIAVPVDDDVARHEIGDERAERADLVAVGVRADVEDLAVDARGIGAEHEDLRPRGVAHVHHRPPLAAVAHQGQPPGRPRALGHAVDREVEAHARAEAIDRRLPQHGDAEIGVGERQNALLGHLVGAGIGGERVGRRGLAGDHFRRLKAVDAAGGRQQVAPGAGRLRQYRAADPRVAVDLVGGVLEELARGVVRDRDEVDHGVDALEMRRGQAAAVLDDDLERVVPGQEVAAEEEAVEGANAVARIEQHRHQRGADVSARAGDQHGVDVLPPRPCLHSSEPVEGRDEEDEAHEAGNGLLTAQGDPAEPFDPLKEVLDLVPFGVEVRVERRLDRAGGVGLDVGLRPKLVRDLQAQRAGVVGRIGDDVADAFELDQRSALRAVAALPRRRNQPHRQPERIEAAWIFVVRPPRERPVP